MRFANQAHSYIDSWRSVNEKVKIEQAATKEGDPKTTNGVF
jgi:hypothetical protein